MAIASAMGGGKLIDHYNGFSVFSQSSIILPLANYKFYFINLTCTDSTYDNVWFPSSSVSTGSPFDYFQYAIVDMKANGGQGAVISRENRLSLGVQFSKTQMMACRHANGKDWWLLKVAYLEHSIYTYLFKEDGTVQEMGKTALPWTFLFRWDNMGMLTFNPKGDEFCFTRNNMKNEVFRCAFDRQSGAISPIERMQPPMPLTGISNWPIDSSTTGLCYSPNGRFLYLVRYYGVQQYDFTDSTWYEVCGLDTTQNYFQGYSATYLGADNKIYIGAWNLSAKQLSRIDNPDAKGAACAFCRKCLRIPTTWGTTGLSSLACQPNYDLGLWPIAIEEQEHPLAASIQLYPNPSSGIVNISSTIPNSGELEIHIMDLSGQIIKNIMCTHCSKTSIDVSELANGFYPCKIFWNHKLIKVDKINVLH